MPKLVSSNEYVKRLLDVFGPENAPAFQVARDKQVYLPDIEFVREEFIPRLDLLLVQFGYIEDAYDCEDHMAEAQCLMNRVIAKYCKDYPSIPKAGNSIAYHEGLLQKPVNGVTGYHAWGAIVTSEGFVWMFEPQMGPEGNRLTVNQRIMDASEITPNYFLRSMRP